MRPKPNKQTKQAKSKTTNKRPTTSMFGVIPFTKAGTKKKSK